MFSVLFIQGGFEAIFGVGEIFLGVLCLRRFFFNGIFVSLDIFGVSCRKKIQKSKQSFKSTS